MPLPAWHPALVHFPLALVVTAAVCLTLARLPAIRGGDTLAIVGSWNLGIGTVCVFLALASGLAAALNLQLGGAAHAAIAAHVKSAVLTTLLVLAAGLWRGFGVPPASRPSWLFLVVLWLATASALVTGYRGGQNVYRYGIGVSPGAVAAAPGAGKPD